MFSFANEKELYIYISCYFIDVISHISLRLLMSFELFYSMYLFSPSHFLLFLFFVFYDKSFPQKSNNPWLSSRE